MLVRMLATAAGPAGVYSAGETLQLDNVLAAQLVAGGYAVAVDGTPQVAPGAAETASIVPGSEAAVLPRARHKRG